MGFFKWLFGKKNAPEQTEVDEWGQTVYEREGTDFHNRQERIRYIENCLEQIGEAQKELDLLHGEYQLVTSYLTDIEEIEALPKEESTQLKEVATKLSTLEKERVAQLSRKTSMPESDYRKIDAQRENIEEAIVKIKEAEKYRKLITGDLNKLDGERSAYQYRKSELLTMMANLKGIAMICLIALGVCLLMLAVLQFGFEMDTLLGFLIAVGIAAVTITVIYVKYMDAQKEISKVEQVGNRLILLQNKVKIRYVNNTNLLEYLYLKYGVDNGAKLEKQWKLYQQERELRRQMAEIELRIAQEQERLLKILRRYQLKDPDRWIHQVDAILNPKDMVEIRHGLIVRRQSLRSQLEYNQKVAETGTSEIKEVVKLYPEYQEEITDMVTAAEYRFAQSE